MSSQIIYLKDLPKHETLRAMAKDYPQVDIAAVELYILQLRLVNDMIAVVEAYLGRYGLSRGRIAILMILRHQKEDRMCAAELARYCGVSRPTMTQMLRGLLRAGLVRREPAACDLRRSVISITHQGRVVMKAVMPDYYRTIQNFSAGLDPELREQLMDATRAMMAGSALWRQSAAIQRHVASNAAIHSKPRAKKVAWAAGAHS
ncbi:MAG: MarR family winged helix-turn-helix transcriptional regulator [Phycisphaerae bacterium]